MRLRFQYLLFVLAFGMAILPLNARTLYWIGNDIGDLWSNSNNWFFWNGPQSENSVPESGDALSFEFADQVFNNAAISFNDLTNLTVSSLRFGFNDLELETYVILGNTLRVTGSIDVEYPETLAELRCGLVLDGVSIRAHAPMGLNYPAKFIANGPIVMEGTAGLTLETHYAGSIEFAGPVSGNGDIRLPSYTPEGGYPALPVKLSGSDDNTFSGAVIMSANRTLELDKDSALAVPGPLFIGTNSQVNLKRSHQIADTAKVAITSGGRLRLEGNTETIDSLCLTNRGMDTLASLVTTDGSTLSLLGNVTAANDAATVMPVLAGKVGLPAGNHIINVSGSNFYGLNIPALIIGGGGFTKTGPGVLTLSGDSTFDGDDVIQEGRVDVLHANALGSPSGATILDGGTLSVSNVAVGIETLWVNGASPNSPDTGGSLIISGISSWAGPVSLNTNLVLFGSIITFSGAISGPAGLYVDNAGTHLEGPDPNAYQGLTYVWGGLLSLNKPPGMRAIGPRLEVHSSLNPGTVQWLQDYQCIGVDVELFTDALIDLNGYRDDFGPITFNSGTISTGTGELGIYGLVKVNSSSAEATINGRLGLPPGIHEFRVNNGTAFPDLRINATVVGTGHLRKTGAGQMWLAASNSYSGLTTVAEGALSVLDPYGLGAPGTGTTVDDSATLEVNFAGGTMPEPLALRGTGIAGNGALGVFGDVTLRNPFPSIFAAIDLTTNTTIGVAVGSRLTVDGFISGIGPLTKVGRGTLAFANANTNSYSGDTIVVEGTLELAKPNFAVAVPGDLVIGPAPFNSSATGRFFQNGGMRAGTIATVNAGSLLDLNGYGQNLSRLNLNDGGDAQTGPGLLSFPVGGIVAVGSLGLLGSHSSSYLSGNLGLPANATLNFAVGAYAPTAPFDFHPELEMFAQIAAPAENPNLERAGIAKNGPGTMLLTAGNSFNGRVEIFEGTLIAANNTALGSAFDGTFVFNAATLALQNGITVASETMVLNSTASPALDSSAGDNIWNGLIALQRDSTVRVATGYELRAGGVISGTGHFTKTGAGIIVFEGPDHNTFAGDTFVNEGPLYLAKPVAVTAVPQALSVGTPAGLFAAAVNYSDYQVIGNIFVNRGAVWNVYGHVENVDHLWLVEGGDVFTESGVLAIKTGGSIQVFPGAVNDPATLSGTVEFLAGAHNINVAASTAATGGPDLDVFALFTSAGQPVTLQKLNNGRMRLSANNNYVGSMVVNAGTVQVDGSQPGSSVVVQGGARLTGSGRTGPVRFGSPSGVVAPGASPGILQVGHFNGDQAGGILDLELDGPTPGSGYDRLFVRGLADLTGVTLQASVNFAAMNGQQFTIVANDLFDAITGEFNGLPEGASVTFNDHIFQITYAGGDGNDVVLTQIGEVYRPLLTIERVSPSSVRLLWPTNDLAFTLQFTTNLTGTNYAGWTPVPEAPLISGTNRVVTNATVAAQKLYRLIKP